MISVLGSGGHAKVVISTLRAMGLTEIAAFDDDSSKHGQTLLGVPIRGEIASAKGRAIIAIGGNIVRERLSHLDLEWVTVIHPSAQIDPSVSIGRGSAIFAGSVLQPDTVIGAHAIINTRVGVDHDGDIGDFAHIAPGVTLAGTITVGKRSFIGTGVSIIPGLRIGDDVTVGAGAVVVGDLAEPGTYVGVPAKRIR